jgi:hypothetical protein
LNNQTIAATNARNSELTALQRWAQDVRNSRVNEAVARTQEALTVNFNRSRDARTRANFADNLRQAEEAGRMAAGAAASGVTGSVVGVIDATRQLKNELKNTARLDLEHQLVTDEKQKEFEARWALEDQKDSSLIFDNPQGLDYAKLDFRTNIAQQASTVSAAIAGAIKGGGGLGQLGGAIVTEYDKFFKTPVDALGFPVDK